MRTAYLVVEKIKDTGDLRLVLQNNDKPFGVVIDIVEVALQANPFVTIRDGVDFLMEGNPAFTDIVVLDSKFNKMEAQECGISDLVECVWDSMHSTIH